MPAHTPKERAKGRFKPSKLRPRELGRSRRVGDLQKAKPKKKK